MIITESQRVQCQQVMLEREPNYWRVYEIFPEEGIVKRQANSPGGYFDLTAAGAWDVAWYCDLDCESVAVMVPPGVDPLTFSPVAHASRWSLWLIVEGQPLPLGHFTRHNVKTIAKAIIESGGLPVIASPYYPSRGDWHDEA